MVDAVGDNLADVFDCRLRHCYYCSHFLLVEDLSVSQLRRVVGANHFLAFVMGVAVVVVGVVAGTFF